MSLVYEPERVAPRGERGVDYGATGRVLIAHGDTLLVWRKGHTGWMSLGSSGYYAAHMQVLYSRSYPSLPWHDIYEGGRLTLARIEEHLEKIREAMSLPMLRIDDIKLGQTLVVESRGKVI